MNKFDLHLDFEQIRERIELDMKKYKPGEWAKLIGVTKSLISNVHGKSKTQNPPLPYIIAIAKLMKKPVEWYLYGNEASVSPVDDVDPPKEHLEACKMLKEILDSGDKMAVPAILSNLSAFHDSVQKNSRIDKLERDVADLRKAMLAGRLTDTDAVASSNIGKRRT